MRFTYSLATLVLATAAAAQTVTLNNTEYATQLLGLLQTANLTVLLGLATSNAATLLPLLLTGTHTIFAPTDAAFGVLPNSTLNDTALTTQIVLYHILNASYPASALSTTKNTIVQSSLNSKFLVNLGGANQVVALQSTSDGLVKIMQPTGSILTSPPITFQNLIIYQVPTVLSIPTLPTITLNAANVTTLVAALNSGNASEVALLNTTINTNPLRTIFAPNNAAFLSAAALVKNLSASDVSTVLQNHIVSGAVYSTQLTNGAVFTTATGQTLSIIVNSTGTYVAESGGATSAKIVQSDVLTSNGAIHIIDHILTNTNTGSGGALPGGSSGTGFGNGSGTGSGGSTTPTGSGSGASSTFAVSAVAGLLVAGIVACVV